MNGPAGQQLGTGPEDLPESLPEPAFELGIIAGNDTLNPLFSAWVPGEDDGKVAVASTRVRGMSDFLVVPSSHTFIMRDDEVIEQTLQFLETGKFRR